MKYTKEIEDELDFQFIQRVQNEISTSCAVPFAVPADRIPEYILQAAQYFWENDDTCVEERQYLLKKEDICRNGLNKVLKLPDQIVAVHGVFKTHQRSGIGALGDFSIERMMLSSYSMFNTNTTGAAGSPFGWGLVDMTAAMFEVSTFNEAVNAPLTYNYNAYSHQLVLLGDAGMTDLFIQCFVRCRIQDLYNNYYFFRKVVCLVKKALHRIYGVFEFQYPGGISVNISLYKEEADEEEEKIAEHIEQNRQIDFIFCSNTV